MSWPSVECQPDPRDRPPFAGYRSADRAATLATPSTSASSLVKAHGWRDAIGRDWSALVEIAYDRDTATTAWADNIPDDLPVADRDDAEPGVFASVADVDFAHQAVVVWSAGESGSCPQWLAGLRTDDGTVHLNRDTAGGPVCTEDYNPYRMLVAVDRDRLPQPDTLPIDDIRGVPDAWVTAYPTASHSPFRETSQS